MKRALLVFFLLAGLLGYAQRVNPQGIIVNPAPSDLRLEVWANKDAQARNNSAVYRVGENIGVYARVNRDAYVYIFIVNADGRIDLILPNRYESSNLLKGGLVYRYPPGQSRRYQFTVSGPEGQDQIIGVASRRPLSLREIADIQNGQVRLQGRENLSRALSIVVGPVPQQDWVSAVAYYRVVGSGATPPAPPPATATLTVESNPTGAQVLVNGQSAGNTPVSLGVRTGRVDLEVRQSGYTAYRTTLYPRPGEVLNINAQLQAERRRGDLAVTSSPDDSEVYVNGNLVGRTPIRVALDEGNYEVRVAQQGYADYRANVQVSNGRTTRIDTRLNPQNQSRATLEITVNTSAQVFVNGNRVGASLNGFIRVTLDPGVHEVTLVAAGYRTFTTTVQIEAGERQTLDVTLERQ